MTEKIQLPKVPGYGTEAHADLIFGSPPWDHTVPDSEKAMPDEVEEE